MAFDLTAASAVLKEDYLGPVRQQMENKMILLTDVAEKNTEDVEGKYAIIPVNKSRNQGVGARAEGGTLPTAGQQGYDDLRVTMAYNYGRIQLSGQTIKAMKSDRGSFIRAIDSEVKGMERDLRKDYNRQLYGDYTGNLAACGATSASATVVLANVTDATKFLKVGMAIDIIDVDDDSALATNRNITAVTPATPSITISGATVTTDSTHRVCRTGSWKKEINGLALICSTTGTFQNINRATAGNEYWKANVLANGGTNRSISEDLIQQLVDLCEETGDAESLIMITTRGVRRKYVNTQTVQKRFVNTTTLKGGHTAVDFNGYPIAVDADAPAHKLRALNRPDIQHYIMGEWDWMDLDGSVLSRVGNTDAYEAVLFMYSNFGCTRCNAMGSLEDITQ